METSWRFFGVQQIDQAFDFGQFGFCAATISRLAVLRPRHELAGRGSLGLALDVAGRCSEVHLTTGEEGPLS